MTARRLSGSARLAPLIRAASIQASTAILDAGSRQTGLVAERSFGAAAMFQAFFSAQTAIAICRNAPTTERTDGSAADVLNRMIAAMGYNVQ